MTAMSLMWTFAEVKEQPYWKAMCWAMLPSLGSAMCACTWHFFYNDQSLEVCLFSLEPLPCVCA